MIIIPMAGLSSRFFKAGFTSPKYMLEAHGLSLFDHAVKSFEKYFRSEKFLFVVRDVYGAHLYVEQSIKSLGIEDYHVCVLEQETSGQAETVMHGLNSINYQGPITIFNIDTFRPGFNFPNLDEMEDGYLEVFRGEGDNWSFAKPLSSNSTLVVETAEKKQISNLCSTGLYHFSSVDLYLMAYDDYFQKPKAEWSKGEIYIAPLYNYLISKGKKIHYHLIDRDEVVFCGTPEEYHNFKQNKLYNCSNFKR
ncbi:glycosyltransferase family 2 protein [Vibrio vulnificus]|uniref:glycosyltransferase family 2 protein n=1 Tax=Vibrio vulnificus TaxID=672 RepID=UPI00186572FA|nr:glycosyltransferase family 2 protein [Vibrio vulnificus]EGR7943724.1 capsular biosynthesis protein [Vibrio vulnificus]EHU9452656.1 glycosyltransferase family 2 protein [Vibrio vulnificus]EHY0956592.1 glycosyltransferase family 2 protein [Vibrio vulnificus]EIU7747082.1 glycosyltransferase family 2 protein [Vibrio vulnificus]EJN6716212.1 glycosyltransferase family 2 protein [Vibrio vulnificus]